MEALQVDRPVLGLVDVSNLFLLQGVFPSIPHTAVVVDEIAGKDHFQALVCVSRAVCVRFELVHGSPLCSIVVVVHNSCQSLATFKLAQYCGGKPVLSKPPDDVETLLFLQ